MTAAPDNRVNTTGGCLCGAVRYEIIGDLRGVVNCHCSKCRRFHGNFGAYTSIKFENLILVEQRGLKWFKSEIDETPNVHRGFCVECGSSLFWHPIDQEKIAVAAGSLDDSNSSRGGMKSKIDVLELMSRFGIQGFKPGPDLDFVEHPCGMSQFKLTSFLSV